jgi:hypothetical protein
MDAPVSILYVFAVGSILYFLHFGAHAANAIPYDPAQQRRNAMRCALTAHRHPTECANSAATTTGRLICVCRVNDLRSELGTIRDHRNVSRGQVSVQRMVPHCRPPARSSPTCRVIAVPFR